MTLTREQDRERMRRRRAAMTPEEREEYNHKARERMRRHREAMNAAEIEAYNASRRVGRRTKPQPAPEPKGPGIEMHLLWAKAHPNSAIRRRYPTAAALKRAS